MKAARRPRQGKTRRHGNRQVVVIGGGLGGMSAAISLAAKGLDVKLYEQNDKLGGKLNVLKQQGFVFDLGPSILILPEIFAKVFQRANRRMVDYVQLEPIEPQWRSFFEDGTVTDLYSDGERMKQELDRLGADPVQYERFLDYSKRLHAFSNETYFPGSDTLGDIVGRAGLRDLVRRADLHHSVRSGVERYIDEPHLREVLSFFIKYVGSSAKDAPGVLNMLPHAQLSSGLWYIRGGLYAMARAFKQLMDELNVDVTLNAQVAAIRREGGAVVGITLADGAQVDASAVVCNMEVVPAYRQLLKVDESFLQRFEKRFEPAASGLVIHLGLRDGYEMLRHHNFFFAHDPNLHLDTIHRHKQLPDDPTLYVVYPTLTDPSLAPQGHHILKVLPHVPYLTDSPPTAGDYQRLKGLVYDKLERMGLRNLRQRIVVEHVMTPHDIQRMYSSNRGSIYGVVSRRWRNLGLKAPKRSDLFDNLYFVGGSTNPGGGTPMVVLCGQQVGDMVARDLGEDHVERAPQRARSQKAGGSCSGTGARFL